MFSRSNITLYWWIYFWGLLTMIFIMCKTDWGLLFGGITFAIAIGGLFWTIIHIKNISRKINNLNKFHKEGRRIRDSQSMNPMSIDEYIATVIQWRKSLHEYLECHCSDITEDFDDALNLSSEPSEPITSLDELNSQLDRLLKIIRDYRNARYARY
jgi:hypothetical protein